MQTFLCSLIVLAAALYMANRWLPHALKQRLMQRLHRHGIAVTEESNGACGSCSSCGNCGGSSDKSSSEKSAKKVIMILSK